MRTLPLEDQFEDILAKAMRGLTLGESELAARTGVPVETVRRLTRGELCDEAALGRLATALNLPSSIVGIFGIAVSFVSNNKQAVCCSAYKIKPLIRSCYRQFNGLTGCVCNGSKSYQTPPARRTG